MKRNRFFAGLAIALLLVMSLALLSSCQTETKAEKKPAKKKEKPNEVPDVATVIIRDFAFNPDRVTITSGGTVTWINRDSVPHRVTGEDFDSSILRTNRSFRRTFDTPGTYNYNCSIHPSMTGTIVVK